METSPGSDIVSRRWFWGVLAAVTFFRLIVAGRVGFSVDEAHYVMYSRHLAWGYFDHPPMVGFLGAAARLLGESPFWYRLGPILCWAAAAEVARRLVEPMIGAPAALLALILFLLMPVAQLLGVALLPDAPLNVFWCLALLASWRAIRGGGWGWWLLAGASTGGAMLSKYHGVLLPLCLFLYLATSGEHRRWLRRPEPYAALAAACLVFLPNVVWNARHDWISYAFQLGHGGGKGGFGLDKLIESIGGQAAGASPVLFGLFVLAAVAVARRPESEGERFLWWTSIPVFVFFCGIGLFGKVLPHWPAVGWWTGMPLTAAVIGRRLEAGGATSRRWRRWTVAGALVGALSVSLLYSAMFFPVVGFLHEQARAASLALHERFDFIRPMKPFETKFDPTNDLYGWEELAARVEALRSEMPRPERTFVFCPRFFPASQLGAFLDASIPITTLTGRADQYKLWFDPAAHAGWDAILVDDDRYRKGADRYHPLFEAPVASSVRVEFRRGAFPARGATLYPFLGFRGSVDNLP